MKPIILFDCLWTLVYKKDLAKTIQKFFQHVLKRRISITTIEHALFILYERRKFSHPHFKSPTDRVDYFIQYNQELAALLGITLHSEQARDLNTRLRTLSYTVYSDVKPALRSCKKVGYQLGVIANWTETLEDVLTQTQLKYFFDGIYSSQSLKIAKPNPRIFTKALRSISHGTTSKIYYVGDDYELDCAPARQAGLNPILIDRMDRYTNAADCPRVQKLTELFQYIRE